MFSRQTANRWAGRCLSLAVCLSQRAWAELPDAPDRKVGTVVDQAVTVTNGQWVRPAGDALDTGGRPLDVALAPDAATLYVKTSNSLLVVDAQTWKVRQKLAYGKDIGGSMHGIAVASPSSGAPAKVYVTTANKMLVEIQTTAGGALAVTRRIALPSPHPMGITLSPDGKLAYVCMSVANTLAVVDLATGKLVRQIAVGVCPYSVVLSPNGTLAYVTNFGGHRPAPGAPTEKSVGSDVAVDQRSIPISGTVSKVDLAHASELKEIPVGLHPAQIVSNRQGSRLFVANANSDSVSILDTLRDAATETITTRPDAALPFGSLPNALALSPDEATLFCANAGNNAVAVIALRAGGASQIRGFLPTAWFPGALACSRDGVFVANIKSNTLNRIPLPAADALTALTAQVIEDGRVPQILRAMERAKNPKVAVPVPQEVGDPSVFHHVVYVLKENKTYDQVFGDLPVGNSDPKLCIYGRNVTPNHHALAEQFVVLDNYYCNGVNSAYGHQWATQGITSTYQEKGTRTYDFGTDALCYCASDFIWDSVLLHGLSFRNYGEFDFPTITSSKTTWFDVYHDWDLPGQFTFKQSVELQAFQHYTCKEYPGWMLRIPDVCRAKVFLKEFAQFERSSQWPNFVIIYLPQDHTSGTGAAVPTPRALVADNDLALGQVVEAITRSKFWPDTCIFVNEDDPQSGYDHVDGHRSLCLVISPYTKRQTVVGRFYNQTGVLHTMTQMLGLPPMNQLVALAPTMEDCFTTTPNLKPYQCLPNNIPLDERNKPRHAMSPQEQQLFRTAERMDFSRPDQVDDDALNRITWLASGMNGPYPAAFAGPHGRGLAALHLQLEKTATKDKDKDDD